MGFINKKPAVLFKNTHSDIHQGNYIKTPNASYPMRILISIDAEGLAGITSGSQVLPGSRDYLLGKDIMNLSANAVIKGISDSMDNEITVVDAHDGNRNIDVLKLDGKSSAILGWPKPLSMAQGVENSDAIYLIGYHSMAGTKGGVLSHTYTANVHRLFINGIETGETYITAAVAGEFGVPVKMFAGDDKAVEEARRILKDCEFVTLKTGISRYSSRSISIHRACELLEEGSRKALDAKGTILKVNGPVEVRVEFNNPAMADNCMIFNGIRRVDGYTVSASADNMIQAYNTFRVLASLSNFDHEGY